MSPIDEPPLTELEATALRTLVEHLRRPIQVRNIDPVNVAGLC